MNITTKEQAEEILNQNLPVVGIFSATPQTEAAEQKRKEKTEPAHLFLLQGKSLKKINHHFANGKFRVQTAGRKYFVRVINHQQNSILLEGPEPANLNHKIKSIVRL